MAAVLCAVRFLPFRPGRQRGAVCALFRRQQCGDGQRGLEAGESPVNYTLLLAAGRLVRLASRSE